MAEPCRIAQRLCAPSITGIDRRTEVEQLGREHDAIGIRHGKQRQRHLDRRDLQLCALKLPSHSRHRSGIRQQALRIEGIQQTPPSKEKRYGGTRRSPFARISAECHIDRLMPSHCGAPTIGDSASLQGVAISVVHRIIDELFSASAMAPRQTRREVREVAF